MDAVVKNVEPGSAAEEGGVLPGDRLRKVNGHKLKDIFDYKFYTSEELVLLEMEDPEGEIYEVEIEKDPYEDLGIEFENPLLDQDRGCANHCIFCFIDQLPPDMRPTLYFKDDDTRLSFLTGNYVTLTNVGWNELARLVKYKMSPINVSVHTTDPELRCFMLGNRKAGDIMEKMEYLARGGLTLNAQIVLVPEVNDGRQLEKTIQDLIGLGPNLKSVSVVPIGLTKHRTGLYRARSFTSDEAAEVIRLIASCPKKNFIYAADEFYIKAGIDFPPAEEYNGFPQLENGVGMCSLLRQEVVDTLLNQGEQLARAVETQILFSGKISVHIATGAAAYDIIKELAQMVEKHFTHLEVTVHRIINHFFGENVTVSGLLTGGDLADQLKGELTGERKVLLLPVNMLRAGEETFLDNMTVDELSRRLGVRIAMVEEPGGDFVKNIVSGGGMLALNGEHKEKDV